MKKIIKYWICNIDDGYDCSFYTYDIETYEQYKNNKQYTTWVEVE